MYNIQDGSRAITKRKEKNRRESIGRVLGTALLTLTSRYAGNERVAVWKFEQGDGGIGGNRSALFGIP